MEKLLRVPAGLLITDQQYFLSGPFLHEKEHQYNLERGELEESIDKDAIKAETPTIMRNPWFIRPFELITKMYGVPSYSEIDPTPFWLLHFLSSLG